MGLAWACTAGAKTVPVANAAPPATECLSSVRRSMPRCVAGLVILVLPEPSACLRLERSAVVRSSGRGISVSTAPEHGRQHGVGVGPLLGPCDSCHAPSEPLSSAAISHALKIIEHNQRGGAGPRLGAGDRANGRI